MPIDQNTYALSIQLALEAQTAFDTLDDFGQNVTDLEEEIASAAQKAIQGLSSIVGEAERVFTDLNAQLTDLNMTSMKITTNLGDATKEINDQFDTGEERLDNAKKEFEIAEDMDGLRDNLTKQLKTHLDLQDEFLSITEQIIKAVLDKNEGHEAQNGFLRTDRDMVQAVNGEMVKQKKQIGDNTGQVAKLAISWRTVWGWIKKADHDTEKFTTTNFRHYGSQQQLLQGARELALTNGVAYESAVEAYAAMGNLKVPREELDKYATAVAQANRTTGVAIYTTSEYVNRLRTAGLSLAGTERQLAFMGEAMRKFGLNTRDVNALMNQSAANAKNAARIFGQADFSKWEEARTTLAGFARGAGHSAEELAGFENWLLNDVAALEQFKALTNTSEKGIDGYRLALLRAGLQSEQTMSALEARMAAGEDVAAEFKAMQQAIIDTQFGGNRAAYEAARAQAQLAKKYGLTGSSIEDVNKLTEIYASTLADQAAEANYTFTQQLKLLGDKVWIATASVLQLVADALLPLVYVLNEVVSAIGWVLTKIGDFIRWMEQIPVIGKVVTFMKWAAGIILGLGLALIFVSGAVISFSTVLGGFGGLMSRVTAGVQAFANIVLILVRALGQAIVIILTSIGEGLQNLGNSVKSVMVPLIALGFALMMAGIGAYFLALGVQVLAEVGWAAVPAMLGLILGVALLGLVLIGLAMLVQGPVAVGLAILALAIFAVGLAALMMGTGIYMAGLGLSMMAGILTLELIGLFYLLGMSMVSLGIMAIAAAPGIYFLSIGMMMLAVAALVMSAAFYVIAAAIQMIGVEALPAFADAILQASLKFVEAAALLAVAGAALAIGAILLVASVALIALVAIELLIAGVALIAGGAVLVIGAGLLAVAGVLVLVAGLSILIGGTSLYVGALFLAVAAPLLLVSGVVLTAGALLISAGAIVLVAAGNLLMIAGVSLAIGAATLATGALILGWVAPMLLTAGAMVLASSGDLLYGSLLLVEAGVRMVTAGALLLTGSGALAGAGAVLLGGMFIFGLAAAALLEVGELVNAGGTAMFTGAAALYRAGSLLGLTSGLLQFAAIDLIVSSGQLLVGGFLLQRSVLVLLGGTAGLGLASAALLVSAVMMGAASLAIRYASSMFLGAMQVLWFGSVLLRDAADMIFISTMSLLIAGRLLPIAAFNIMGSMITLSMAGAMAIEAGTLLTVGSLALMAASVTVIDAAVLMAVAGGMLRPAAWSIYSGLLLVEFAIYRFAKTVGLIQKVGMAIAMLANSFWMLHQVPLSGLRDMSVEVLGALPNIEKLGDQLVVAAQRLDTGVKAFEGPAERLNALLMRLGDSIAAFGSGLNLAEDVVKLAEMLDIYADLLENASARIETAVATKVLPAMKAAEGTGINETVRSEAISTVQVIDKTEGRTNESRSDESTQLLSDVRDIMESIRDRLDTLNGSQDLTQILAILQAYLPSLGKGGSELGTEMNSWTR